MRLWAFIFLAAAGLALGETTNTMTGVRIPIASEPVATVRTNTATKLVDGINSFSTNRLNAGVLPTGTTTNITGSGGIVATQTGQSFDLSGTNLVARDGSRTMLAILNMGGFGVSNSANGTASTALITLSQLQGGTNGTWSIAQYPEAILRDGSRAMTGILNLGGFRGTNGANGTATLDLALYGQLVGATGGVWSVAQYPDAVLRDGSRAWTAAHNAGGFNMTNMLAGTAALHAVNLTQLQGATNTIAASSLTGTIADERMGANVALLTNNNAWGPTRTNTLGVVGVGITSPLNPLHVVGSSRFANGTVNVSNAVVSIVAEGATVQFDNQSVSASAGLLIYETGVLKAAYSYRPTDDMLVFGFGGASDITVDSGHTITFGSNTKTLGVATNSATYFTNGIHLSTVPLNFGGVKGTNLLAGTAALDAVNYAQLTNQVKVATYTTNLQADLTLTQNTTTNLFSYTSTLGAGALVQITAGGHVNAGALTISLWEGLNTQLRGAVHPTADADLNVTYSFIQTSNTLFYAKYAGDAAPPSLLHKRNYIDGFMTNLTFLTVTETRP